MVDFAKIKPVLTGAVIGAIAITAYGFMFGGWVTGGTAEIMAKTRSSAAVVAALVPACVEKFKLHPESAANLVALKALSSWQQSGYVEKGGWANTSGATTPNSDLARACATALTA